MRDCSGVPWSVRSVVMLSLALACPATGQDTATIRSDGPGLWGQVGLVEELRIGVIDGDEDYIFGHVGRIAVRHDGQIVVAESEGPRLRLYDASGRYVRTLSRPGAGPGEIRGVSGLAFTPDGDLATLDLANGRITVFGIDGEVRRMIAVRGIVPHEESFRIDTARVFWVRVSTAAAATTPAASRQPFGYLRVSPQGTRLDLVPVHQMRSAATFLIKTVDGALQPFVSEEVQALSPFGYLVHGSTTNYAFHIADPAHRIRVEREYTPVALRGAERENWQRILDSIRERFPASNSTRVELPSVKPAFKDIDIGDDGRVWIQRYTGASRRTGLEERAGLLPTLHWREQPTFDVFEATGAFLGSVTLPWTMNLHVSRGQRVWGTILGEYDETYVVRYRLAGAT